MEAVVDAWAVTAANEKKTKNKTTSMHFLRTNALQEQRILN